MTINDNQSYATKKLFYLLTMTMNMYIVMTMNIYITKDNEDRLHGLNDWTMSGLVNYLLNKWFEDPGHNTKAIKEKVEKPARRDFPKEMSKPLPVIKEKEDVIPAIQEIFPEAKFQPLYRDKKNKRL